MDICAFPRLALERSSARRRCRSWSLHNRIGALSAFQIESEAPGVRRTGALTSTDDVRTAPVEAERIAQFVRTGEHAERAERNSEGTACTEHHHGMFRALERHVTLPVADEELSDGDSAPPLLAALRAPEATRRIGPFGHAATLVMD